MMRTVRTSPLQNLTAAAVLGCSVLMGGCTTHEVITHGAVISQDQIDLIPVGSSKDQVLLALGTPSTTGTFDNEVYYYISQRSHKKYAYSKGQIVDQRVLAVYFDEENVVANVANYGMQDGKVFDFISRTTPTGGKDVTFLGQILSPTKGKLPPVNPLGTGRPPGTPGAKF